MAWKADSKGFWYTRYPSDGVAENRHFYQHVYLHKIGTSPDKDPDVLGRDIPNPKIAEIVLDNAFDPSHPLAIIENGDSGTYVVYALSEDGKAVQVAKYEDQVIAAAFGPDHALYLVSRKDAGPQPGVETGPRRSRYRPCPHHRSGG
jgi:prolyl oligopeptidase